MPDDDYDPLNGGEMAADTDAGELKTEIARLARLDPLEYEVKRIKITDDYNIRVSVLDEMVQAARPPGNTSDERQRIVEELAPWDAPVDGADLAEEIHARLCSHVTFAEPTDPIAATLWIFGTYLMDEWRLWPKMLISSPTKRCGKSTLLECMEAHVSRSFMAANVSTAAIFRTIENHRPTLLIDEADTFLRHNREATGILNAGHTKRTATVVRLVGDNHETRKFCVWGAQVIAGIGAQADTLTDRSIRIDLRRQLTAEKKTRLPAELFEQCAPLRRRVQRWAQDHAAAIRAREDMPPECGNDRAQDNWTPLFRIASVIGGPWPERGHTAYLQKEMKWQQDEDGDTAVQLLRDVHMVFLDEGVDKMFTAKVHRHLTSMADRPWRDCSNGQPISQASIARRLKDFGIKPRKIRIGEKTLQGYVRADIDDAFQPYAPAATADQSGTLEQINESSVLRDMQSGTQDQGVPLENPANTLKINGCSSVPHSHGGTLDGEMRDLFDDLPEDDP